MARAALIHEGIVHACEAAADAEGTLFTPILGLLWGVYETLGTEAFRAVRQRLLLDYPPTLRCLSAIKVGAKRWRPLEEGEDPPLSTLSHPLCPLLDTLTDEAFAPFAATAFPIRVVGQKDERAFLEMRRLDSTGSGPRHTSHRPVHAALISSDGSVLFEARNTNALNKMRHAEVNLLLGWHARTGMPFPAKSHVVVSLKPCRMCSSLLFEATKKANEGPIRVHYLEEDPGPHARGTCYETEPDCRGRLTRLSEF